MKWAPLLLAALAIAGCESSREGSSSDAGVTAAHRPPAYHPDQFPDLPFDRLVGYRLTAEDEQIALAIAGGALRRLSVTFITKPGDDARDPIAEFDRLCGGLASFGWRATAGDEAWKDSSSHRQGRFAKGDETLVVHASAEGDATTIAFRLEPRAQP